MRKSVLSEDLNQSMPSRNATEVIRKEVINDTNCVW